MRMLSFSCHHLTRLGRLVLGLVMSRMQARVDRWLVEDEGAGEGGYSYSEQGVELGRERRIILLSEGQCSSSDDAGHTLMARTHRLCMPREGSTFE